MTTDEFVQHVKELQTAQLSRVFYKLVTFAASAILVPLLMYWVYGLNSTLGSIETQITESRVAIARIEERVTAIKEAQAAIRNHHDANFDATKSQVRDTTRAVDTLVQKLEPILATQVKPKKRHHAHR